MRRTVNIDIQAPLGRPSKQKAVRDSPARFKVLRWGRRAGKTRVEFICSTVGHGAEPNGLGFLTGGEILWVARDYPNAHTVWRKEILMRFANKPVLTINKQDKLVEGIPSTGFGSLMVVSAENIDSHRGGDWDGVVIDEAAHMDLDYIWHDVIRPGLTDRKGWAIFGSTTRSGSYFNDLCERVIQGEFGPEWQHWHSTAFDNPKIDDSEIEAMISDYRDEVKLKQEVYAELVVPGGLAFGEWNTKVHLLPDDFRVPDYWGYVGCLDWGYVNPGYFALCAIGPDKECYVIWEFKFKKMQPYDVGYQIGTSLLKYPKLGFIAGDAQMFGRTESEHTTGDQVQAGLMAAMKDEAPGIVPAPKGPGSRVRGVVAFHQALSWEPDPDDPTKPKGPWAAPRLRFHPDCGYAVTTIPKLRRDEKNPEDVDTTMDDHAFDALKGLLLMHFPPVTDRKRTPDDIHPGIDPKGHRKKWERLLRPDPEPNSTYVRYTELP